MKNGVTPMHRIAILSLVLLLTGCNLLGGLEVRSYASNTEPPSNVAVYLSVTDGKDPVTGLSAKDFTIVEDEQPLEGRAVQLTLLDRDAVAAHHTLLLVDISAAAIEANRRALAQGAAAFVDRVRKHQGVTVMAFDGAADLLEIGEFPQGGTGPLAEKFEKLATQTPRDASRNLHGAMLEGLKQLDARLMREKKRVRIGTLVVLLGGPDLARRATAEQVADALDNTSYQTVAVGGGVGQDFDLEAYERNGAIRSQSMAMANIGLQEAAARVNALYGQYYLVQYCSPSRSGMRQLRIEVNHTDVEGNRQSGDVGLEFDSTGFGPGCDASKPPRFLGQANAEPNNPPPSTSPDQPSEPKQPPPDKPSASPDEEIVPPPEQPGFAPLPSK